jgi:4-carboxymuconolactone decarboxylase
MSPVSTPAGQAQVDTPGLPPTFGRYAEIPYNQMTAEQQEGYRALAAATASEHREPSSSLPGPLKIWVHNPKLAKAVGPLVEHMLPGNNSLTEREREIAVCLINSTWHAAYSTDLHARRLEQLSVPAETVEALVGALPASFADAREQVVYEMVSTLLHERWVPQTLYERAVKVLGHVGITDVTVLLGEYTAVSLTLAFYDVPAGAPGIPR